MKEIKFTRQTKDANIAIHFYTDTKTKPSIITPLKFLTQLLQSFSGQGNFSLIFITVYFNSFLFHPTMRGKATSDQRRWTPEG